MEKRQSARDGDRLRRIGDDVADAAEVMGRAGARSVEASGKLAREVLESGATWMRSVTTTTADAAGTLLDRRAARRRRTHESGEG